MAIGALIKAGAKGVKAFNKARKTKPVGRPAKKAIKKATGGRKIIAAGAAGAGVTQIKSKKQSKTDNRRPDAVKQRQSDKRVPDQISRLGGKKARPSSISNKSLVGRRPLKKDQDGKLKPDTSKGVFSSINSSTGAVRRATPEEMKAKREGRMGGGMMKKRMKRGGTAKKKRAKRMGGGMMKKRMKRGGRT
tara:strand:- start:122 stop:694 length:573 start_codon:yes stop_codon:yes gene_type:complete